MFNNSAFLIGSLNKGKILEFEKALAPNLVTNIGCLAKHLKSPYDEPPEYGSYFLTNALIKLFACLEYLHSHDFHWLQEQRSLNWKIVAEDSGLCVPELDHQPGVNSAVYGGLPRNDEANIKKLVEEIGNHSKSFGYMSEKRLQAYFVSFILVINKNTNIGIKNHFEEKNISKIEKELLSQIDSSKFSGFFHKKKQLSLFDINFQNDIFVDIFCGYCNGYVSTKKQNNIALAGHGYDPIFYFKGNPFLSFASKTVEQKNQHSHRGQALKGLKILIS